MTNRHGNHKIMSLVSSIAEADNGAMTITLIPPTNAAHAVANRRQDSHSQAATPNRTLRRRLGRYVRNAVRDRQPMVTVSEQVLSDIHNVHSIHR
jgi:hypothetical protein